MKFLPFSFLFAFTVTVQAADRPNIILFVTDDQNREGLACYGGNVLTPHLDRLAGRDALDNAHAPSTVCTPSRYTLLTGRFPGNSYFDAYLAEYPRDKMGRPGFNVGLEEDNMNIGNVLRESGYVTGLVGKLHVGPELKHREQYEALGLVYPDEDADANDPEVIAGWQRNEKWYREWVKGKGFSWAKHIHWQNVKRPYGRHNPEWTLEAALEFIEANKSRPFYLHYCTTLMHGGGGKAWNESMKHPLISGAGKLKELPKVIAPRAAIQQKVEEAGFDAETAGFTWMDATVGAMLEKLDELGISDNTLFVFVSDHGTSGKWSLHDHSGTAVPCIMRWPQGIEAGSVSSSLIQTTDFVPTFLDIAGGNKPADYRLDGTSLRPLFSDPEHAVHDHLYFELGNARAVRTRNWKYLAIRYDLEQFRRIQSADLLRLPRALAYIGNDKNLSNHLGRRPHFLESDQLYHLAADPMETSNLARTPEHARRLDELKTILTEELQSQARPFGEFVPGPDSVPVNKIEPFVEKLAGLKVIKRGFQVIDADTPEPPTGTLSREERKKQQEERKKQREKRNQLKKQRSAGTNR